MKVGEFNVIVSKLRFERRDSKDKLAWLIYDGKVVVRTKTSHGSGDVPCPDLIRQQLKMNEKQLRECIKCSFGYDDYIAHLKSKGIIQP